MNIVAYYRARPSEPEASKAALIAQHDAVASWRAEHSASVLAEFMEDENGSKARPQLGKALALCRRENARLLIARTNPIGSGESFGSLYGSGISGVRCERLTQPVGIVVYLRTRSSEPDESASFLSKQRDAVAAWLTRRPAVPVAEYMEDDDDAGRLVLLAALAACRQAGNGTTLLIGTIAAIGTGTPLQIPPTEVPVKVAWTPPVPPPSTIRLPDGGPEGLAFYFTPERDGLLSVYLCNPGPDSLVDVQVASLGETTHDPVSRLSHDTANTSKSVGRQDLGAVPAGTCQFIDRYSGYFDADCVTSYQVSFASAGSGRQTRCAVIGTGGPDSAFVRLGPIQRRLAATSVDPQPQEIDRRSEL